MSQLKITKGEFKETDRIDDGLEFDLLPMIEIGTDTKPVADVRATLNADDEWLLTEEDEANAELIKEAFNVATETGLTPKQLLEQRDELLADLKFLVEHIEENGRLAGKTEQAITNFTATYHATIAKAEGRS